MSERTFGGMTLKQLRGIQLPEEISHSEESVTGAILEPDVTWFEHLQRINGLQQIVRAWPQLLDEIERLNREAASSQPAGEDTGGSVPAPHIAGSHVPSS